jgi:hypothetical protein
MKEEWVYEYEQCSEDRRHFSSESWQIPSTILGINGVLLGFAYKFLSPPIRGILILFGAFFSFIFTWQIIKLAFRSKQRLILLIEIEKMRGFRRYTDRENIFFQFPLAILIIGFVIAFTIFLFHVGIWNLIPN